MSAPQPQFDLLIEGEHHLALVERSRLDQKRAGELCRQLATEIAAASIWSSNVTYRRRIELSIEAAHGASAPDRAAVIVPLALWLDRRFRLRSIRAVRWIVATGQAKLWFSPTSFDASVLTAFSARQNAYRTYLDPWLRGQLGVSDLETFRRFHLDLDDDEQFLCRYAMRWRAVGVSADWLTSGPKPTLVGSAQSLAAAGWLVRAKPPAAYKMAGDTYHPGPLIRRLGYAELLDDSF